jgi:Zn-dependent protease
VLALGIFPFDAILPTGWFVAYLGFLLLLPLLILAFMALRIRLNAWREPQHSPVDPATLPREVRRYTQPWLGRLGFLGFASQGCTKTRDPQDRESYVWRMVHGNDRCVALVKAVVVSPGSRPALELTLLSFLPDGAVVVTADRPLPPRLPAHWQALHRCFGTLQEQVDLHRRRMEGLAAVIPPPAALPDRLAAEEKSAFAALLSSGDFNIVPGERPAAVAAITSLPKLALRRFAGLFTGTAYGSRRRSDVASVPKQKDEEEETPVVEARRTPQEIVEDYLQRYRARTDRKPDRKYYLGRIFLAAVTLSFMILLFGREHPVRVGITTIGLVTIHEFGHWIMMKLFGYTGMGRFFIPFLAPLDRGRKLHAPAWQQFTVILAGPLPGLMVGIAVLVTGYFIPSLPPLVPEIGAMAVLLNAFHLLPFLPLDGGKVVDLLVFRDLPIIRPFFTGISAIAVFAASIFTGPSGRVLRYIAITMLAGLAWDIRMIKVVRGGRRLGWADAEDEDETLRRIFTGIQQEGNEEFFRDASWHRQIEVLLAEVMRKRPKFVMRVFGGALYGATFVLPFALVIGVLSIAIFGLFGNLDKNIAASAEYQKDFPLKTTVLAEAQTAPISKAVQMTGSPASEDSMESLFTARIDRKKRASELSPALLPVLDRLNWQHAGVVYHESAFAGHEISIWLEILCAKLESAYQAQAHAEALRRAETVIYAVTSMEPALLLGDRELFRDAELRSLAVIEKLAASGKLDPASVDRLDKRISLLNIAPSPEVENKLLVDGWTVARVAHAADLAAKDPAASDPADKSEGWKDLYRLIGEGFENLGHLNDTPVCTSLAAEWKKTRRVGELPGQLAGAEHLTPKEADYILHFCEDHRRMQWRRLVTLSALRMEGHRLKKGQLPAIWKHSVPGGAIITLEHNSGPMLRLDDKRDETNLKLPGWIAANASPRPELDYDCPLFGAELSKK